MIRRFRSCASGQNCGKNAPGPFHHRQASRKVLAMMRSRRFETLGLACLLGVIGGTALADCSDFAAPGVNWRRCPQDGQDLRGVNLSGATLDDASFKRTDLSGALLAGADARRAKFVSAIMHDIDLQDARLIRADLTEADLTGARLDEADLLKAVLAGATWIDGKTICAQSSVGQCH